MTTKQSNSKKTAKKNTPVLMVRLGPTNGGDLSGQGC